MNIPPFPSQDLAKLVLGYLAEEQLMTAYDEFLQASPYLDALGNEYDRIFMTSLKNILAEYRAVKIHVETCKPFVLRKKLFQCSNLLDMVKFLIQHIDVNKINDVNESKCGQSNINNNCEVCKSLICTCKKKNTSVTNAQSRLQDTVPSDTCVETTSLTDLPGNHVTCKRKSVRDLDDDVIDVNDGNTVIEKSAPHSDPYCVQTRLYQSTHPHLQNVNLGKRLDTLDCKQKEEFNNILNQVCHKNQTTNSNIQIVDSQKVSMEGYNNFATGVAGGDSGNVNIPDSSTSESVHVKIPLSKESMVIPNVKQSRTQYLLKVANVNQPNEIVSVNAVSTCGLPRLKPNIDDNKIKILSDVKVDNSYASDAAGNMKMPQVLKNATSTPLLQMQTIVINGTPVYKHKPLGQQCNYTKDEIMAMPTIILAPVAGTLQPSESVHSMSSVGSTTTTTTTLSNSARQLGPLVIDVNTATNSHTVNSEKNCVIEKPNETKDTRVSKIIDITSVSAPKDNTVTGLGETNTPQVLPPVRKSSSTPRRTSHVRVLDFATPRRILHESINKCPLSTASGDVEVVISQSPKVDYSDVSNTLPKTDNVDTTTDSSKENSVKINPVKKKNWDADLRALAIINEKDDATQSKLLQKPKKTKKKKNTKNDDAKKDIKKISKKNEPEKVNTLKKTSKILKNVSESKAEEVTDLPTEKVEIPIKPTINIITGTEREPDIDKSQNKSGSENVDTPEMERISLQNEIGAKLNISDLLETPYKQVLYDIQMETPRFLGPDIAEDPLSAIKIMSIPTPRFLNDPTPSSYSSRPTDYSSGGSYYKPDDQDYMRIADDLECAVTTSSVVDDKAEHIIDDKDTDSNRNESDKEKPSRPVRKCTKNVSYYNSSTSHPKTKETDSICLNSSFSDTEIVSHESPQIKDSKTSKEIKSKHHTKSDKKLSSKHRKSPVKKDLLSKSFMKIKPRRPTPVKRERKKRKTPEKSKSLSRRKSTNKDIDLNVAPVVVPAPTKSRRKSSTPRKLHCTKAFNSESSGHDSPELLRNLNENLAESNIQTAQDSDTEHLPLRWSDDGSQDAKLKESQLPLNNDIEDISKIQDYIKTVTYKNENDGESSLHKDLVKRGFDLETAKIIERELLDSSPMATEDPDKRNVTIIPAIEKINEQKNVIETNNDKTVLNKTLESDCCTSNLQIIQNEDEEDDEIELSVHECNEESTNYFTCLYDDTKDGSYKELPRLKDKFSMEVCLDEDLSIRLRATAFNLLVDQNCEEEINYQEQYELDMAVRSITNMNKLYTPMKKSIKAQCYDIFDSTLTSLDTPLKVNSPTEKHEVTVTEIVLEVEKMESQDKTETKKRKRGQSGNLSDECSSESKKAKPEAQYLLNSANIQNIDIESVLSKLHGP